MNKISKIIFGAGLVVGVGFIFTDRPFSGIGVMFLGLIVGILADPELSSAAGSSKKYGTPPRSKEPYYKDEFEEYQHYKHCKRHMRK